MRLVLAGFKARLESLDYGPCLVRERFKSLTLAEKQQNSPPPLFFPSRPPPPPPPSQKKMVDVHPKQLIEPTRQPVYRRPLS